MDSPIIAEQSLMEQAFAIRKANFTNDIKFYAPGLKSYNIPEFEQKKPNAFLPISITGNACALDCDHCDTKILDPMIPLDMKDGLFAMCKKMAARGTESVLISGGSMRNGQVPFMRHIDDIKRIKDELGLKIIMHTGLVSEEMAEGLAFAGVDGVALDIIGAQDTIEQVYHMNATVADFDATLERLTRHGLSIRPHIIIGLHYGKMLGEYAALEMIKKYPTHALILVILTPLHDTPMRNVEPPAVDEVAKFYQQARLAMPDTNILVGCARPAGEYKKEVDVAAVNAGLNGIAYPAAGVIDFAKAKGLQPSYYENSCSCGID
jgi:lipoyl synthase